RRTAPSWYVHIPRCCRAPPAGVRRNGDEVLRIFKKKGGLLARDTLGLNRAKPVAKARLRQIDSPVGPFSDLNPLHYANNVMQPLNANSLQTLTLPRSQRINPQIRSALKAV
ncbi:MAG TPA: hypothetical protein VIJ25_19440, partial [Methylococcales bacterium]